MGRGVTIRAVAIGLLLGLLSTPTSAQQRSLLEVGGATVAYQEHGEGEPVLLLHGFGETGDQWAPIAAALASDYRVIVPDLRGHGGSTNPQPHFTHREAAADIRGLLDALDLEEVQAVGFSSGGMTLLHLATAQPNRFSAIALVGTTPFLPEAARQVMRSMNPDTTPMTALDAMGLVHGDTVQARYLFREFVRFQDSYTDVNFTPPVLSTISARTLVIHGDRDPFFPIDIPVDVYRAVPLSYLMVFPNLGHQPFPEESEGQRYYIASLHRFFSGSWDQR